MTGSDSMPQYHTPEYRDRRNQTAAALLAHLDAVLPRVAGDPLTHSCRLEAVLAVAEELVAPSDWPADTPGTLDAEIGHQLIIELEAMVGGPVKENRKVATAALVNAFKSV